jgi:hypothetical protein
VVRNCGFSETFFFVVCDDIWIAIYPSFVVVVEELKGLAIQALQSCRLTPTNSSANQWNAKSQGLPYSIKYLAIISIIIKRRGYNILAIRMLLHW